MTKKQLWACRRNWLILRLKGALSIFSLNNEEFMYSLTEDYSAIGDTRTALSKLISSMQESKWEGK